MKPVLMFTMKSCPYCREAHQLMEEIKAENRKYASLEITVVDERLEPAIANKYDYYYVPTYYVGGVKIHEGAVNRELIRKVFEEACD